MSTRATRGETFAGYTDLEVEVCTCGVLFAAPAHMLKTKRHDGSSFYCPNGHSLSYDGDKKRLEQRVRQAEERETRLRARLDQEEAHARAQKARATRFKNDRDRIRARISEGVCPCCNRTFKQVAAHMKRQHPEFKIPNGD